MDAKQLLILGASVLASSLSGRAAADGTQDPYVHTSAWLASKMSAFTSSSPAHLAVSQAAEGVGLLAAVSEGNWLRFARLNFEADFWRHSGQCRLSARSPIPALRSDS